MSLPITKEGEYFSAPGETREDFLKRPGRDAIAKAEADGYEHCFALCEVRGANSATSYAGTLYTFRSHISCPILGSMCPAGSQIVVQQDRFGRDYNVGMHSHGSGSRVIANRADQVLSGGLYINGVTNIPRQTHRIRNTFSSRDYTRPGYLYGPSKGLMWQEGRRTEVYYGQ